MRLIITVLALVLGIVWFNRESPSQPLINNIPPSATLKPERDYFWKTSAKNLILINNTPNMRDSEEVATESGCLNGINAFYYDTNNKPLGLLIIEGKTVNKIHNSNLLNGFIYIEDNKFIINNNPPLNALYAHQAGPLIIYNYQNTDSQLDNKNYDMRSIAIQTEDDQAGFAFLEEATLAEIPQLIRDMGTKNGIKIKNAINLDGGSSTAFWASNLKIKETFRSGGFWCAKD